MAHGAGGKASRRLVEGLFAPLLFGSSSEPLGDAAHVDFGATRIAITTDSFVVKPLRFPGGSIGELAVNGTVNDLAVSGAKAEAMVVTYVLEAGLPTPVLEAEVRAMADAARTGGSEDCGRRYEGSRTWQGRSHVHHDNGNRAAVAWCDVSIRRSVRPGDKVLLSGPIGDHGITILLARGELDLEADLSSDTRSVLPLVEALVKAAGPGCAGCAIPRAAASLPHSTNWPAIADWESRSSEEQLPVRDAVRGACELLGLDPLHIANEGQFLAVVAPEYADAALNALNLSSGGEEARVIGEVREQPAGSVLVTTLYGGSRIVDMLVGDPLPRIC